MLMMKTNFIVKLYKIFELLTSYMYNVHTTTTCLPFLFFLVAFTIYIFYTTLGFCFYTFHRDVLLLCENFMLYVERGIFEEKV